MSLAAHAHPDRRAFCCFGQNAESLPALRSELLSFPAGKHDDIVDALGLVGQLLDTIKSGNKPSPLPEKRTDSGYRRWEPVGSLNDWIAL